MKESVVSKWLNSSERRTLILIVFQWLYGEGFLFQIASRAGWDNDEGIVEEQSSQDLEYERFSELRDLEKRIAKFCCFTSFISIGLNFLAFLQILKAS